MSQDMNKYSAIVESVVENIEIDNPNLDFLRRIYSDGITKYEERIVKFGMSGAEKILDAGAGFGQWSCALAQHNKFVVSVELDEFRQHVSEQIFKHAKIDNIASQVASVESLPFENESFDKVLCYGVALITDWKKTLSELSRVLKPGGLLYINMNGEGWYDFLTETNHNATEGYNPADVVAQAKENTERYNRGEMVDNRYRDIITSREELSFEHFKNNLIPISICNEGETNLGETYVDADHFFKPRVNGKDCVYEIVSRKLAS